MRIELSCVVNGVPRKAQVYPMARLLDVLREDNFIKKWLEACQYTG